MAFYALKLPGGVPTIDGVKGCIVEADSEAAARRVATAQYHGDAGWADAVAVAITAGKAADYTGFTYQIKVSCDPTAAWAPDLLDVSYVGVASDTVDLIGAALVNAICGEAVSAAQADDGGVYTDETTEANDASADDMHLLPAVPASGDAYVFGSAHTFARLSVNVSTAGTGTYTIAWKYWNGTSWAALTGVTDDTDSFKNLGLNDVVFTVPTDWALKTIGTKTAYYIRAVVDAGTTTAIAAAAQAWVGRGFRASYNSGTNVLTVAAIADGVGKSKLEVTAKLPGASFGISDLVGTIVDGGSAAAVLSVVLTAPTAIPWMLT